MITLHQQLHLFFLQTTMSSNAVIEIFCKDNNRLSKVTAVYDDDDENLAFTNKIFTEAMKHYVNTSGDPVHVFPYKLEELERRIDHFLSTLLNPSGGMIAKLHAIVKFIKMNSDTYKGIKVYV